MRSLVHVPLLFFLVVSSQGFLQPAFSPRHGASTRLFARQQNQPAIEVPVMNEEIKAKEIRVIASVTGGKDEALGIMSLVDALAKAKELGGLDLILINDKADPPVCKIADYSKYRYMLEKKAKELKKNSKATEIKEVKMSYKIDVHDYDVRKKSAIKFIKQGNRVKATVMFRGREVQHDNLGFDLLEKLAVDLSSVCIKESRPKREGRNISIIFSPKAEILKAVNDDRKNKDKSKKQKKRQELEERMAKKDGTSAIADDDDDDDDLMDDEDYDDDDEDIDDDSLDSLLGSDKITDDLFSR
ncbi:translation initiation factor IF-3 [Fistulifera solaris]|jgi:translation initiation factor IF-3|uniref:Translation initiation factor IF-3 n=1 Tax=Fistulifera solaris TaxID=1519565 RepID=A0A1Z5JUP4_FISSO|nr:translation initiation factor IF-3 [Fistulifera solaris]|eukprot:GAX17471.1 translation initiation factor IF-3 [Fistulifera solaris]